ncbi:peptide chain release factor N(5)-glutamine methyltransferase [Kineococcus gynurae]|uniref:Release factor glutamine methyltransferase n=1 Tax=Kineococcus gynurae TaxID=452979 RepID=A0ABV5LMX8_9ACTN
MPSESASDVRSLLEAATATLAAAGVPTPRVDAEVLLAHDLGLDRSRLSALQVMRTPVTPVRFSELLALRADRIPLQHLTGVAGFRGLTLRVGPGVFVPRPETETVAQLALDAARAVRREAGPVVVDLCTGSGAIALAVATELPGARVHAVELDPLAHAWARRNVDEHAERLDVPLDLRLGDAATAFEDLRGQVDVVVSNPPYVPPGAVPQEREVAEHDPELALYGGGEDGLAVPRRVLRRAATLLRPGGYVVLEHAEVQAGSARAMFVAAGGWTEITGHRDLTDRPRATSARRAGSAGEG